MSEESGGTGAAVDRAEEDRARRLAELSALFESASKRNRMEANFRRSLEDDDLRKKVARLERDNARLGRRGSQGRRGRPTGWHWPDEWRVEQRRVRLARLRVAADSLRSKRERVTVTALARELGLARDTIYEWCRTPSVRRLLDRLTGRQRVGS